MEKDFTKLIQGCIDGKRKSQKQLFEKFQRPMFGICLRYAKDYTEAEDIAQEGFVKVFRNISQFKGEGSFVNWMKRIMINTALERYRKMDKLYLVSDYDDYEHNYEVEDVLPNIASKELLGFIQELSPQYRTIFSLYAIEGYSHIEISKMLDISEGTSKSNLSRARAILQKKVEKYYGSYKSARKTC